MKVEIFYCGVWNYYPVAFRLKEELEGRFSDIVVKTKKGSDGILRVVFNDNIIFDKYDTQRFPEENEISDLIEKLSN